MSSYYEMAFEVTLRIILITCLLPLDVHKEENCLEAQTTEKPEVTSLQDKILENIILHQALIYSAEFCLHSSKNGISQHT